jgi:hypothetical protein
MIPVGDTTTVNLDLTGELVATATLPIRPGDFNHDSSVDAADYVVWRNDPSVGDYQTWRANFGQASNGSLFEAVPEPATIGLTFIAVLLLIGRRDPANRDARRSITSA